MGITVAEQRHDKHDMIGVEGNYSVIKKSVYKNRQKNWVKKKKMMMMKTMKKK